MRSSLTWPGGSFGHLAHALPAGVIDVPGALALMLHAVFVVGVHRLALGHLQLVSEVPLHDLQLRHAQHVAVGVVAVPAGAVGLGRSADGGAGQAVAPLAGFEQAGFV